MTVVMVFLLWKKWALLAASRLLHVFLLPVLLLLLPGHIIAECSLSSHAAGFGVMGRSGDGGVCGLQKTERSWSNL